MQNAKEKSLLNSQSKILVTALLTLDQITSKYNSMKSNLTTLFIQYPLKNIKNDFITSPAIFEIFRQIYEKDINSSIDKIDHITRHCIFASYGEKQIESYIKTADIGIEGFELLSMPVAQKLIELKDYFKISDKAYDWTKFSENFPAFRQKMFDSTLLIGKISAKGDGISINDAKKWVIV